LKTDKILKSILNKKIEEQQFLTGTVSTLSPLKIRLYPGDNEINVVATSNLINVKVGSRLLLIKFQNQFIALSVINSNYYNYPKIILKTADESITNSTTLQNDNHLVTTLEANFLYEIDCHLYVLAGTTGDFKCLWTLGGSASFNLGSVYTIRAGKGIGTSATSTTNSTNQFDTVLNMQDYPTTAYNYGGGGGGSYGTYVNEKIIISTLSGSGTLTLQWAQAVSNATATIVKKGSYVKITPVYL
jgi:hypothetical protein